MKSAGKKSSVIAWLALSVLSISNVNAIPITWNLLDVTFNDGATASGFFTFDYDVSNVLDWSINVNGGDEGQFAPFVYDTSSSRWNAGDLPIFRFIANDLTPGFSNRRELRFTALEELDGSSSLVDLQLYGGPFTKGAEECYNCNPTRGITSGHLSSGLVKVPVPATLALVSLGLLGLKISRYKHRIVN